MSDFNDTSRYQCEDCGSSDGLALMLGGKAYCHACPEEEAFKPASKVEQWDIVKKEDDGVKNRPLSAPTSDAGDLDDRSIPAKATERYGVMRKGAFILFPYCDADGNVVAYKERGPDKSFNVTGDIKKAGL